MKNPIFALLWLIVIEISAQIQITENNSSRYVFAWNLDHYEIVPVPSLQQKNSLVSFSSENTILGENGEAAMPGHSILLGIPPKGEIKISFNPIEIKTVTLDAPPIKHKNTSGKRQPDVIFKTRWISEPVYGKLQGMSTARLIIRPFIYDEKSNTMQVLLKGSCTIEFPSYPHRGLSGIALPESKQILSSMVENYHVARGWQAVKHLSKITDNPFPVSSTQKVYRFSVGDGNTAFAEMTTNENGILKIPGDSVIRNFGKINIDKVVLFASFKGELPTVISDSELIPSGLVEVPLLRIDNNKNKIIDSDDYLLAFVTGASDWSFDEHGKYSFKLDRYDDYRNYWLTTSTGNGMSIDTFSSPNFNADTLSTFDNQIILGKNSQQLPGSEGSLNWSWSTLNHTSSYDFTLNLPGIDTSVGGSIRINSFNNEPILAYIGKQLDMGLNGYEVKKWATSKLKIIPTTSSLELKNIETTYKRKLIIGDNEKFEIFSPSEPALFHFKLKITTDNMLYILRVSKDEKHVSLVGKLQNAANNSFVWSDTGGRGIRYVVCSEEALTLLPAQQKRVITPSHTFIVRNPRNTSDSTDYLIISAPEFVAAAEKLAQHKKKVGFKAPRIVNILDIYDAFSGGDVDPSAIRNFIAYVQDNWAGSRFLSYVVLFGSGHYDYKGVISQRPIYIPVYYEDASLLEDYFTTRDGNDQAVIGRITCDNENEALAVVDKIIAMEDPDTADFSDWRNRALFVADDDMQGTTYDNINHHLQSDRTASVVELKWPSINIRKVYLFDYKWNTANQKPEASKAIVNEIDDGVGYVNFFGHGSEYQWAQEKVLLSDNVEKLQNENQYPLISSFSCSVGKFDMPRDECLSSVLLKTEKAGAIAAISSTRLAYATSNERLAINFYTHLFNPDTVSSIGLAFLKAKTGNFSSYSRSYAILGDPSMVIARQTHSVKLDILDKSGVKIDTSLMALQQVTISGTILDKNGKIDADFGSSNKPAFIHLGLFNAPEETSRKDGGENLLIRYTLPGSAVFMGRTQIHNGKFKQSVQLPGNLSFDKYEAKLAAYAWRNGKVGIGTGCKDKINFSGTDSTVAANDSVGPEISIRPIHEDPKMVPTKVSFSGHVITIDSLKCEVDLYDQSGIDIIGIGPDEGLTMEIEGVIQQKNINHKFRFNEGDYRRGSVLIKENDLKPGTYTLNFSARDLRGNLSKSSFQIKITEPQEFELDHVFNSPNPFRMGKGTKFYFFPTKTAYETFAAIKIYTLSGKPVRVIKNAVNGQFWDGRDQTGTLLGPDIYLYQIVASAPKDSKKIKSKIKKLVINP